MTDSMCRGLQPTGQVPPKACWGSGETVSDLFGSESGFALLHFTCPVLFQKHLRQPWPSLWRRLRAQGTVGIGGWIRSLKSGVRRAFPTLSRLGDCSGKRGAASAWKCQCGLQIEARLPGSASSSSFIRDEGRNRSHRTLPNFISLFLYRRQRVWESLIQFRIFKKKKKEQLLLVNSVYFNKKRSKSLWPWEV